MNAIGSKQHQALEKTRKLLHEAEIQRKNVRFIHFIRDFSNGKKEILKHREFAENLAAHLARLHSEGKSHDLLKLIEILAGCICDTDDVLREHAVCSIVEFSGTLVGSNNYSIIIALFKPLVAWFAYEEKLINGYGVACSQLHKLGFRLLEHREYWKESAQFFVILRRIYDCRITKDTAIKDMAVKLQASLATRSVLDELITCYLNDKSELKAVSEVVLSNLGRRSIVHMINILMHTDSKEERLLLVKLIPEAGPVVIPVLAECLQKEPPWYVVRNVIFIASELDEAAAYDIVRPYLSHEDIRVQQQVLRCIVRSSSKYLEKRMIYALFQVHDELKMPVIMQLARIGGADATLTLLELLNLRKTFKQETYIELLVRLCRAFQLCATKEVIHALRELIKERQQHVGPSDPVISTARDTILSLKSKFPEEVDLVIAEAGLIDNGFGFHQSSATTRSTRQNDLSVKELVEQGDLEEAGKKLYANALKAARDNDFVSAELLRDKILEISPLALSEVIKLGEIIEEEKSSSISSHHIAVWSELYEMMTTEEFNALYFALKLERYNVDDLIVRAGDTKPSLYFVNSGVIILSCHSDNRDTVLKRLQPGEVVGVSPFFDSSVWTVTMTARTGSQVHVLSDTKLKDLEKKYPGIQDKLHDYCVRYDTVPQLLQMAGSDRRKDPRYAVSVCINNMLLDPYGNIGKRMFKGELIDISRGGLRFSVNISSRENARLLLGRQIISEIEIEGKDKITCFGIIVGGRFEEEGGREFSVHVNFHQNLERSSVALVKNLEM